LEGGLLCGFHQSLDGVVTFANDLSIEKGRSCCQVLRVEDEPCISMFYAMASKRSATNFVGIGLKMPNGMVPLSLFCRACTVSRRSEFEWLHEF
jgi:hypothetical protein